MFIEFFLFLEKSHSGGRGAEKQNRTSSTASASRNNYNDGKKSSSVDNITTTGDEKPPTSVLQPTGTGPVQSDSGAEIEFSEDIKAKGQNQNNELKVESSLKKDINKMKK